MKRMLYCLAAIVLVTSLVPTTWAQSKETDPAEWAPADALVYFGISDTERLWRDVQKLSVYQTLMDQEAHEGDEAANVLGGIIEKFKQRLAKLLGIEPAELKNPFAGPFTMFATAPPGAGSDQVHGVLIAGVGDSELMRQYTDTLVTRLKEASDKYDTVSAGRETIHTFTSSKGSDSADEEDEDDFDFDDEQPSPFGGPAALAGLFDDALDDIFSLKNLPEKMAICLTENRLIVAGTDEDIKAVLAGGRSGQSLDETDEHRLLLKNLKPVGQVRLLVNLPRLFEMAKAKGDQDNLGKWFGVLGANSLRSLVGHARIGAKSYDTKIELLFLMSGERTGLAKLLSMKNRPVAPPAWVSASTSIFASFNFDPPKLVDDILRIMSQSDPSMGAEAASSLEQGPPGPDGQPLNMRKDLIDHLAGPLTGAVAFTRPYQSGSLKAMLALGHRNREALTRVISILSGGMPPRDFRGTPIYTEPRQGNIAITENQILYGNQAAVEAALSADEAAGLVEDLNFKRAKRFVPEEAWCMVYSDERKLMEALIELAEKQGELTPGSAEMMLMFFLQQMGGMDLSDTAKHKKALKYSSASIMTIATTTDGVRFTMVGLRPQP